MTLASARQSARYAATAANGGASWEWMRSAAQMAAPVTNPGYTGYARVATRTLSLERVSVRRARDFTLATLRRWGVAALADDMGVVVSELLTNALRHACQDGNCDAGRRVGGWPVRFGLLCPGSSVLCAVADPSPEVPVMREPDYLAETGRGLHVVASLSDSWGWTIPGQHGKVVWALLVPQWRPEEAEVPPAATLGGDARAMGGRAMGGGVMGGGARGTAVPSLRA
jgi:hypothetical protein